jgi:hypothetical protein
VFLQTIFSSIIEDGAYHILFYLMEMEPPTF